MFRGTQSDTGVKRWIRIYRDGDLVDIVTATGVFHTPSGANPAITCVEEAETGLLRLELPDLTESGKHWIEVVVNGEHLEEPIEMYVRPLNERGPR